MAHDHSKDSCPDCAAAGQMAMATFSEPVRTIPYNEVILAYLHCRRCLAELPEGISAREYARFSVGLTEIGLQVWCNRHERNVVNIDFLNQSLPANSK